MKIRRASKKVLQALRRAQHRLTPDFLRSRPRLVFVFSTRGELWQGMGRDLLQTDVAFRHTAELCDVEIKKRLGWSVLDALAEDTEPPFWIQHEERLSPALLTVQLALVSALKARGIQPDAVFGFCMGELGATYAAGIFSLTDVLQIVCGWSKMMKQRLGCGKRAVAYLSPQEAHDLISRSNSVVEVACEFNSDQVVLAGETPAMNEILEVLAERQVATKALWGEFAFHSTLLDSWEQPLSRYLQNLNPCPPCLPLYSARSSALENAFETCYGWAMIRQPVYFQDAAEQILQDGYTTFIEIGPHPVFGKTIKKMAASAGKRITYLPAMKRDADGGATLDRAEQRLRRLGYVLAPSTLQA